MSTFYDCSPRSDEDLEQHIGSLFKKAGDAPQPGSFDRRISPRIAEVFPARTWGVDASGNPFNLDCVLDNISANGLYVRLPRMMDIGSDIRFVVHFFSVPKGRSATAVYGTVVRDEPGSARDHGIAVRIERYEFL